MKALNCRQDLHGVYFCAPLRHIRKGPAQRQFYMRRAVVM